MKKSNLLLSLVVPVAFFAFSGCTALKSTGGKTGTELTYQMNPGQSFTMKAESSNELITEQMGQEVKVNMKGGSDNTFRILNTNSDGTLQCEMEFISMKQSMSTPMGENETDYSTWIGKKVMFNLSPAGGVSGFSGFELLPELTASTGEKVTGNLIQKSLQNEFFKLPDQPVKMGETWTVLDSLEIPYADSKLKQKETTVYKIAERTKYEGLDCIRIEAVSKAKISGEFVQQGMQIEMTRETTANSVIYFAIEKGMYISVETTSTANGQVYIPDAAMTIPQKMSGKSSTKVVFN